MNSLLQWFVLTEIINKDGSPEEGQRPWLQQKNLHIDPGFYNFNLFQDVPCGQLKTNYVNLYPFTVGFFFSPKRRKMME